MRYKMYEAVFNPTALSDFYKTEAFNFTSAQLD